MHRNGQNELTERPLWNFSFLVKKSPLFGHFSLFVDFSPFFEKGDFGDFSRSDPQPWAVRLSWKFFWELFRARQSPHKIFSSNGQHTAEDRTSKKRQNRLFQKSWKIGQKAKSGQKVAIFWPKTKNFAQISYSAYFGHFCVFWAICLDFQIFRPKITTFDDFFSRAFASDFHNFGDHFEGSWWVQTNCWKCTF